MGQSEYDILENDEVKDIHYLFFEKYHAGKSTSEIESWFKGKAERVIIIEDGTNYSKGIERNNIEPNKRENSPLINLIGHS